MNKQPTNRRNLRRAIACLRAGDPLRAPHHGLRLYSWVAGNRHRAKHPVKTAADLDRPAKRPATTRARQWRIAPPGRTPNPPLPAQQRRYQHKMGIATLERKLRELRNAVIVEG
jgi:hypothetical protein